MKCVLGNWGEDPGPSVALNQSLFLFLSSLLFLYCKQKEEAILVIKSISLCLFTFLLTGKSRFPLHPCTHTRTQTHTHTHAHLFQSKWQLRGGAFDGHSGSPPCLWGLRLTQTHVPKNPWVNPRQVHAEGVWGVRDPLPYLREECRVF